MGKNGASATFSLRMTNTGLFFKVMVLTLAATILVYLGVGQLLAASWTVETARTLAASPAAVGAKIQDLASWQGWCAADANLGEPTVRTVTGTPGTVGQRIVWTGPKGEASLLVTALSPNSLEYRYGHRQGGPEPAERVLGTGAVSWEAEGAVTRLRWRDGGDWDSLPGKWVGWFGALQQRYQQVQGSSLVALEQLLTTPPPAADTPTGTPTGK
jgi:Polyketide cyclase / dehydrase and lipid transport